MFGSLLVTQSGRAQAEQAQPEQNQGEAPPPDAAMAATYAQLIREAVNEFSRGNWSESRAFFQRAHAIQPSARTLRGLGLVAYELQHYVEAESLLVGALDATAKRLTDAQRAETEEMLAKTRALIGRYRITLLPKDAHVLIDGRELELPVQPLALNVGEHHLVAHREGFLDVRLQLDVRGGEDERLEVRLRRAPARAPMSAATMEPGRGLQLAPAASGDERGADGGGSVVESPWLWLGVAAAAAGGVVLALALSSSPSDPEPIPSTSGVTVVAHMTGL